MFYGITGIFLLTPRRVVYQPVNPRISANNYFSIVAQIPTKMQ